MIKIERIDLDLIAEEYYQYLPQFGIRNSA